MGNVQLPSLGVQLIAGVSLTLDTHRLETSGVNLDGVEVSLVFPDPGPPVPPGPDDRLVQADDGLVSLTIPYTSVTGNVIVRIFARNNAASQPDIDVTWNGDAMDAAGLMADTTVGHPVCAMFVKRGGFIGTGNIVITCAAGSAGRAAVRVGDVQAIDASYLGVTGGEISNNYYYEAQLDGRVANSGYAVISGTVTSTGYAFSADGDIDIQWNAQADYVSAMFGVSFRPTNVDDYFVSYPEIGQLGATLVVELKGLELVP